MIFFLSQFAPEILVWRDRFARSVLCQPVLSPHSGWIWFLLTGLLPLSAAAFTYLYRQLPLGQFRVYRVTTRLRYDGAHCRESAGARQEAFKVVRVRGATFSGITMVKRLCAFLFPRPLLIQWACAIQKVLQAAFSHRYRLIRKKKNNNWRLKWN